MPVSYYIDAARGVVFTTFRGDVTLEEVGAVRNALRDDPDFRPTLNQLNDFRAVTTTMSAENIGRLARMTPFGKGSRRAIVVESDLLFGLSRMYELSGKEGGAMVEVFKDVQEARTWLGIEEADD